MPHLPPLPELHPGGALPSSGQLGFIPFTSALRLSRHINIDGARRRLLAERILVLGSVGLIELAGELIVVPHACPTCPAGVQLADGSDSEGEVSKVYEYEDVTGFFPTASTGVVREPGEYVAFEGGK